MKRKISDILDHYSDSSVELNNSTPLSSDRIKELTMNKINHTEKKGRRILSRIFVAAAIIATLAMTAFAAEEVFGAGDWFREILNLELQEGEQITPEDPPVQEEVSEEQVEIINDLGRVFEEQTQTSEGTAVTMHAAYGDASILHLYFSLEAPEGTVLPDDIVYTFHDGNRVYAEEEKRYVPLTPAEDAPYQTISQQMDVYALPDADPGDNKKDFHAVINGQAGTACRFTDGYAKFFHIQGLWQQIPSGGEDGYRLLAPGTFAFDVGLTEEAQRIQLEEAQGLSYGGEKTRTWTHDSPCLAVCGEYLTGEADPDSGLPIHSETYNYQVTVMEMSISSMGVESRVEYTCDDQWKGFGLNFRVMMKDGTSPGTGNYGSGTDRPMEAAGGIGECWGISYFDVPIDLDQVDYILIGDPEINSTYKIYIP